MDRYLYLKNVNTEKMAKVLCGIVQDIELREASITDICNICPATNYCRSGHNGFIDWLKEEKLNEHD